MRIFWRRLLTAPSVRVLSSEDDTVRLKVEGLACDGVCAVRAQDALRRVPGVRDAIVDFDSGIATVVGTPTDAAVYDRAVKRVVAGMGLRRVVEHAYGWIRRRRTAEVTGR